MVELENPEEVEVDGWMDELVIVVDVYWDCFVI